MLWLLLLLFTNAVEWEIKIKVSIPNDQVTREGKVNCVYIFDALKAGLRANLTALWMLWDNAYIFVAEAEQKACIGSDWNFRSSQKVDFKKYEICYLWFVNRKEPIANWDASLMGLYSFEVCLGSPSTLDQKKESLAYF